MPIHQTNPLPANDAELAPAIRPPRTTAEAIVNFLVALGIRIIFGIPGGPLMSQYNALRRVGLIRHVLIGDEQNAPFFAYGYWCASGGPAAICATSGSVSKKLANGLACAKADLVPMFALIAQASEAAWGRHGSQDSSVWGADTVASLRADTAASVLLDRPERLPHLMNRLAAILRAKSQPVLMSMSPEVASADFSQPVMLAAPLDARPVDRAAVKAAARLLASTRRRAVLVGSGVLLSGARAEVLAFVERFRLPAAVTPRAVGALGETAFALGPFGFAGSLLAEAVLLSDDVEVIVVIGSRLGELSTGGWDPRLAGKRIIQIDIEPTHIGMNFPVEVGVVGDARATIVELMAELEALGAQPGAAVAPPFAGLPPRYIDEASLEDRSTPIKPQLVVGLLRRLLSPDAMTFSDIGNSMAWLIHYLPRHFPYGLVTNLGQASMGHALPAAVGAKLARPDRQVAAVIGDCAWRMSGTELVTAKHHGVAPLVICLNSGGHAMVEIGAKAHFDGEIPSVRFDEPLDIAAAARADGCIGIRVVDPAELEPAIVAGLRATKPTLIDVLIDPTAVPPMGARLRTVGASLGHRGGGIR
jgi:acetolactate synthase I/II/III large subunit